MYKTKRTFKINLKVLRQLIDIKVTKMLKEYHGDEGAWARYNEATEEKTDDGTLLNIDIAYRVDGNVKNICFKVDAFDSNMRVILQTFMSIENDIA